MTLVESCLADFKAQDVLTIPLAEKSSLADYMIIASGTSSRQVASMADNLVTRVKRDLGLTPKIEGQSQADWVLVDLGDIIVHLFRPEVREFYALEKMWAPELEPKKARH